MNLQAALEFGPGITAVIGSGGKTTLLRELARELRADGSTVALVTSTRILPFSDIPTIGEMDEACIAQALATHGVVCLGEAAEKGKLAAPKIGFARLAELADYVLVEADGSRRLPLKAHEAWEPVIPAEAARAILVVGASGFGRPIREVAHRPELFCRIAGRAPEDPATPEAVAKVILHEALADLVVVNQCEAPEALACARELAEHLSPLATFAGSIRDRELTKL